MRIVKRASGRVIVAIVVVAALLTGVAVLIWPDSPGPPVKISISSPYPSIVSHPDGVRQKVTLRVENLPNLQVNGGELVDSSLFWTGYERWNGDRWLMPETSSGPIDVTIVDTKGELKWQDKWDPDPWKVVHSTPGEDHVELDVIFPLGSQPFRLRFQVFRQATVSEKVKDWMLMQKRIKPWKLIPLQRSVLVPDQFVYSPPMPRPEDVDQHIESP